MSKLFGLLFLIGWVVGQLIRLPGEFPVTILDVAVAGIVITHIRRIRGIRGIVEICLVLIVSWGLGLGLYLLRFLGYLWVIVNAGKLLSPVKKFITPAFWIFITLAWAQYLFLPDTRFLLRYGWDEHYYRMIGTVLDPNYLGIMLVIIGISGVIGVIGGIRGKWLGAVALAGLVVTYSRASWLAMGAGFGWWVLAGESGKLGRLGKLCRFGLLVIFGAVVWWAVPKPGGEGVNLLRTSSIEQRLVSWNQAIELWKQYPWFGVGFNQFGSKLPSSSWLTILQSTGVVGLMILGSLGILVIRKIRGNSFWEVVAIMLGIHAVFNNTLFYPPVLGLLALIKAANED